MRLIKNKKIDIQKWKKFFRSNSHATPFQTPEFYNFYNSIPGYSARVFAIEDDNNLKALCVVTLQKEKGRKGYFSRRAIIYGGPLIEEGLHEQLKIILLLIYKELKDEIIYIEIRNFNDYSAYKKIFIKIGWRYMPYLNVQLNLQNKNSVGLLNAMHYNRRREIKLSISEGASYEEASTINDVEVLYQILANLYKTRVKLPLPDFDYFKNLFLSPIGKVFIVKHNNIIIGGTFCFYYEGKSVNTVYYCGIRDYHKKIFPTHLAILAALEFGIENNLKILDFMGAGKTGEEYGVRNYKTEFGGEMVGHGRFIKICNPFLFNLGKFGLKILKKI